MEIKLLNFSDLPEFHKTHLKRDFPTSELRRLKDLQKLTNDGIYYCYGYFKEDTLIAYASLIQLEDNPQALLDYFAVVPTKRQGGIGSRFLLELIKMLDCKGLLIEVETIAKAKSAEEMLIRKRRIAFYEKCGAQLTPISGLLFGVHFSIMNLPIQKVEFENSQSYQNLFSLYKKVFPPILVKLFVRYKLHSTS